MLRLVTNGLPPAALAPGADLDYTLHVSVQTPDRALVVSRDLGFRSRETLVTTAEGIQSSAVDPAGARIAATRLGIDKVVMASSETVLGLPFETPPPYVPVDEEYPARPESVYSLGKHLEETMAIELCRWHPQLSVTALRFSNVMDVEDYAEFPSFDADAALRRWNLWGYIDGRDGAQAVEKSLAYTVPGFDCFIIASPDTVMSRSNADLVAEQFPGVEVRGDLGEHDTLLSIDKARRILGYDPQHLWRGEV